MSTELGVLGLSGLLTMVAIVLAATAALPQVGLPYLASSRDERRELTGAAGRLDRAAQNTVVGFALFAPAVLIVHVLQLSSPNTLLAAQAFLVARVVYIPLYGLGIPWLRTGVWAVGFVATLWLYVAAL